ncbi:hypothetical protein NQ318_000433 [Aromia moschata]|uniref:Uncharacterized protein n=1 Tax=Aromia moschata TaxID=1265417 RepID=A0AAV8YT95_9CUCU|nr:hypothetical protein NQ318_000433 [Aromia moschata]
MNSEESALFFEHLQKLSTTDETTSEAPSGYNQQHRSVSKADNDRVEQIYTTPRTYNDLKALFTCKNKNKYDQNEKPNKPCLCQNCAILGLLSDAQKRPFVTENSYDPREHTLPHKRLTSDKPKRKKSVNFKDESHTECEYYFRYLSSKIKTLEERLAIQEERSVTKEYFKKIITKLVNHISKLTGSGQPTHEGNHQKYKDYKEPRRSREKSFESSGHRYYVHPVLIDQKLHSNVPVEKDASPIKQNAATTSHMSSGIPTQGAHDSFWKWGEEILKPGIDLKNKIIDLLEETLQNLRRPKEKRLEGRREHKEYHVPSVPERSKRKEQNKTHSDPNHSNSGSSISKQLDYLTKTSCNKKNAKLPSKLLPKQDAQREEPLNVSYVSPKIKGWHDESQFSFKFESSDIDSTKNMDDKKLNECYKQEFMQTICNTKEADKLKLWQNIWNQAKVNGQSRHDKVTIQIPNRKDLKKNKMIEIEYTIEELESLLIGKAPANKANFSHKKK